MSSSLPPLLGSILLGAACLLAGCSGDPSSSSTSSLPSSSPPPPSPAVKVTMALNWFAEHEHGGYFEAHRAGLYLGEGVAVDIQPGGPNAPVAPRVGAGQVDFGVMNADELLMARAQGVPLVALMAPMQTSPQCIMVHKSTGITQLSDLSRVTLAIEQRTPYFAWMEKKLPLKEVKVVPASGSIAPFLADPRFTQQAYSISEPLLAEKKGSDPTCLLIADIGFNPYTSILVTQERTVATQADVVRKVVRASLEGWRRYMADPAATNKEILALNPAMDEDTLTRGVTAMKPLVEGTPPMPLGVMTEKRWGELASAMMEAKVMEAGGASPTEAFTLRFLAPSAPPVPSTQGPH